MKFVACAAEDLLDPRIRRALHPTSDGRPADELSGQCGAKESNSAIHLPGCGAQGAGRNAKKKC